MSQVESHTLSKRNRSHTHDQNNPLNGHTKNHPPHFTTIEGGAVTVSGRRLVRGACEDVFKVSIGGRLICVHNRPCPKMRAPWPSCRGREDSHVRVEGHALSKRSRSHTHTRPEQPPKRPHEEPPPSLHNDRRWRGHGKWSAVGQR